MLLLPTSLSRWQCSEGRTAQSTRSNRREARRRGRALWKASPGGLECGGLNVREWDKSLRGMAPAMVASERGSRKIKSEGTHQCCHVPRRLRDTHLLIGEPVPEKAGKGSQAAGRCELNRKVTSRLLPLGSLRLLRSAKCSSKKPNETQRDQVPKVLP